MSGPDPAEWAAPTGLVGPTGPTGPAGGGRPRWLWWVAAVLVLVVAVGGGVALASHLSASPGSSPPPTPVTDSPTTTPTPTPSQTPTQAPAAVRAEALDQLLRQREQAVLHHDAAGWLATVDPKSTAYLASQQQVAANLAKLPLTAWSYTVEGKGTALSAADRANVGPRAWAVEVDLAYRFGAADRADVHSTGYLTLVRRSGRWLIAGDTGAEAGQHSDTEIWDLGPLEVVSGSASVVIGLVPEATLRSYAGQADTAIARVSAVWGRAWPRRVVVLAPKTQEQMARLLDKPVSALDQIAAVTTGELRAVAGKPAGGADQVIVNPKGFAQLGTLGKRVVVTHEITHVAVRASTPRQVPIWLSEGFADYVGYDGLGLPPTDVASDVLGLVRRGIGPTHLPGTEDFDATQTTIGPSYSGAWLACTLIADTYGQDKLIALYRATAGATATPGISASDSPDVALRKAFRAVLGVSEKKFTANWLAYLTTLSQE